MFAYFWNSDSHLYALEFWVEIIGCLIEVGIAVAAFITLREELPELRKKTLEKQITALGLVAALMFVVLPVFNHRISQLQEIKLLPKPLATRLYLLLSSIDSNIPNAIITGYRDFKLALKQSDIGDLQKLAAEPDSKRLLSITAYGGLYDEPDRGMVTVVYFSITQTFVDEVKRERSSN